MQSLQNPLIATMASLLLGVAIGLAFGLIEERIRLRRAKTTRERPSYGFGSSTLRRTAYLLATLVAVQALCPLLFSEGLQWSVSAGLLAGYGMVLCRWYIGMRRI